MTMAEAHLEKFKGRKSTCRFDVWKEKVALENDQSGHN
jgi:hypothetical protein